MRYISDEEPGICSQEDFDHDFKLMIDDIKNSQYFSYIEINSRASFLMRLAAKKRYHINL